MNTRVCLLLAILLLPVLCSRPAVAQTSTLTMTQIQYGGKVLGLQNGSVQIGTPYGTSVVSTETARFSVGGINVSQQKLQTMAIGTPVVVTVPASTGTLVNVNGSLVTMQTGSGMQVLPVAVLPEATKKQKVYVQLANGNVVQVPLNAAVNMQRAQGAKILGASGARVHGGKSQGNPGKGKAKAK